MALREVCTRARADRPDGVADVEREANPVSTPNNVFDESVLRCFSFLTPDPSFGAIPLALPLGLAVRSEVVLSRFLFFPMGDAVLRGCTSMFDTGRAFSAVLRPAARMASRRSWRS